MRSIILHPPPPPLNSVTASRGSLRMNCPSLCSMPFSNVAMGLLLDVGWLLDVRIVLHHTYLNERLVMLQCFRELRCTTQIWMNILWCYSVISVHIHDRMSFLFQILVHLGLLSKQSGWKFAENQFKGTVSQLITLDSNGLGVNLVWTWCELAKLIIQC